MRYNTAFMDRIYAYLPGWDVPKLNNDLFTTYFGLVSDVVSKVWNQLRDQNCLQLIQSSPVWRGAKRARHDGRHPDG